jgi:transcriptional regulator
MAIALTSLPLTIDTRGDILALVEYREETVAKKQTDVLQGTLDMLILKTVALEPQHGWGISQRIQQVSDDVLQVNQGSLYPALHRLEQRAWLSSSWGTSENNRQAKFYQLTRAGRRQLVRETKEWTRLSTAVGQIMEVT